MVNPSEGFESRSHLWRAGTAGVLTLVIVRGNRLHIQSTFTYHFIRILHQGAWLAAARPIA